MKDYKKLMPVVIVVMALLACYSRINDGRELEKQYQTYLDEARAYRQEKIYVDAKSSYQAALEMHPTKEIYQEMGETLLEEGNHELIQAWGESMIEQYPKEPEGYTYVIKHNIEIQDYKECFEWFDIVQKRGIETEELNQILASIEYKYELSNEDYDMVYEFIGQYAVVERDGKYGLINQDGEQVLECKYLQLGYYNGEVIPIQDGNKEFYFVDKNGQRKRNVKSDIRITKLGFCYNGIYTAGTKQEVYFLDSDSHIVLGPYEDATSFNIERAAVKENGKWYLIDFQGNRLSKPYLSFVEDDAGMVFRNGVAFAQTDTGYVMLDQDGHQIGEQVYEDARCFSDESYTAVKLGGKWGYIDNQGEVIIEPEYENAKAFKVGYAAVCKDGRWGYINERGQMVIKPTFMQANLLNAKGITYVQDEEGEWNQLELLKADYGKGI